MSNGYMGGIASPGERVTGHLDAKSQVWLVLIQGAARLIIDFLSFVMALIFAFAFGGWGDVLVSTLLVWSLKSYASDWLVKRVQNIHVQWLILRLELIAPALCFIVGAAVVRFVLPFWWDFDFTTKRSYLVYMRNISGEMWTGYIRFPLLLRAVLIAIPAVYWQQVGPLRRRFVNEIDSAAPLKAIDPSVVTFDPRKWGPKEEPAQAAPAKEVRIRKVAELPGGSTKVEGYDDIPENYIDAIRLAFEALNAGTIARISRAEVAKVQGIGQHVARAVTGMLRDLGYIEYPNGDNNAAKLTDYGRGLAEAVENGEF